MKKTAAACAALLYALLLNAQDVPMPKMFRAMEGEKGQYQVEILEGGGRAGAKAPVMTLCTDNLMNSASERAKPRAESDCRHRLLKDTASEAVMESVCKERTTTLSMKREGKSVLMDISSTGARGPQTMKMRYTHLGPCSEGQGAVTFDKNAAAQLSAMSG